jgi:hypothetical protein
MNNARSDISSRPLRHQTRIRERRGAMLVLVAVVMVVLLGFLAMTLDVGSGNRQRRIAQAAADAGALAGAWELYRLRGDGFAHDSAIAIATREVVRNGFLASDIVSPCPCNPPISGPHTGDADYIEVPLLKTTSTIFGSVFGMSTLTYGARGVGGVVPFAQDCLVSLDPSGSGGVWVDNGGSLSTTYIDASGHQQSCGVSINSSSGSALDVNNSGQLDAGTGAIGIVGNWTGNKTPSPAPSTGIAASINPLSWVTMPTITTCDTIDLPTISKDTVLLPGVYCNGINVDSKTATLRPGTYYMAGGGFTAGTSAIINGDGVTIVTTVDPRGIATPKGINFSTGCKAKLIAPTSGTFPGIVFFGDPAMPTNTLNIFACASNDSPEISGAVYFPNQKILFDGSNSGTEISGSVIAASIASSGKVTIMNDISGASVVKHPTLVE